MLGLGKNKQPEISKPSIPVVTIPTEFYAAANPTLTFKNVEKVITPKSDSAMPPADKKAFDKSTSAGNGQPLHPATLFSNQKKLFLIGGGLFVLFIILVGGYYFWQSKKTAPIKKAIVVPKNQITATVAPTTTEPLPEPIPEPLIEPTIPVLSEVRLEFPTFLSKSDDLDNDGLTDQEEELFKSDPGIPDTDDDSYLDGSEVFHLYNPVGKEPIRLIESGSVEDYVNPAFGYAVYYPVGWAIGNVDGGYRDMLFSAITGENIEIRVFDKAEQQNFSEWLAANAPSEKIADIADFSNRFNDGGFKRSDDLVYYYVMPTRVYVIAYHTVGTTVANYPAVVEMMARSFRRDSSIEATIPPPPLGL